jgi:hypothetical protein
MLENDASLKISSREYIEDTSNTDAEAYAWTSIPAWTQQRWMLQQRRPDKRSVYLGIFSRTCPQVDMFPITRGKSTHVIVRCDFWNADHNTSWGRSARLFVFGKRKTIEYKRTREWMMRTCIRWFRSHRYQADGSPNNSLERFRCCSSWADWEVRKRRLQKSLWLLICNIIRVCLENVGNI